MSGDTLKRVKSVKRWLEKAENSYSNHKELTGEMNLIMAQAEMQRLKEVRGTSPRRKWLLRGGALAVAGALFLGASFLKDSFFAPAPTPARPVETAVTTPDAAVVPVEEIVVIVIFVVCIGLIIVGQRNIGPKGLLTEIVGLAGLVGLLAFYNSKYK